VDPSTLGCLGTLKSAIANTSGLRPTGCPAAADRFSIAPATFEIDVETVNRQSSIPLGCPAAVGWFSTALKSAIGNRQSSIPLGCPAAVGRFSTTLKSTTANRQSSIGIRQSSIPLGCGQRLSGCGGRFSTALKSTTVNRQFRWSFAPTRWEILSSGDLRVWVLAAVRSTGCHSILEAAKMLQTPLRLTQFKDSCLKWARVIPGREMAGKWQAA
jgi:hypothetical protein